MGKEKFITTAKEVLAIECNAITALHASLDDQFSAICQIILACEGRVIVTGMGKSGHIGGKIAATLASTGTPAFFVHPGEASHGDLGMITRKDVVLAISHSGETPEILTIIPIIKRMDVHLIGMTGSPTSTLAKTANFFLHIPVHQEACPMNLAPTASTTACLALGDAVAISVLKARDFNENDFARSHPGGALGKRLLLYVNDIMQKEDDIPIVYAQQTLSDALIEMSSKGLGMTAITDENQHLIGIFTDGDLRRTLANRTDIDTPITQIMSDSPITAHPDTLAAETIALMQNNQINSLLITQEKRVVGALNMQMLLNAGVL